MNNRFNLGLFVRGKGGNHKIADVTINLGSTKGRGSSTRMFNYCKQTNPQPWNCINQFINIQGPSVPTPTCDYTFTGTGELTQTIVNNEIGAAQNICIVGYTSIGNLAFYNNTQITSVTISGSVTSIGIAVFRGCSALSSIAIPNSVTTIGTTAFTGSGLTSVTIPNSVISIGESVFWDCIELTSVIISNSITSIKYSTFENCTKLASVTIPNSVTTIEVAAFKGSGLTSIIIGNSVTNIGEQAFVNCTALTSINIPNSVISIFNNAFLDSGLTNVTISSATAFFLGISGSPSPFFGAFNVVMTYT
jgi:hypothetical protein